MTCQFTFLCSKNTGFFMMIDYVNEWKRICVKTINVSFFLVHFKVSSLQRKYISRREEREEEGRRRQQQQRATDDKGKQTEYREPRGRLTRYVRSLKWTPIPISMGFALLAYQHYRRVLRRSSDANSTSSPYPICKGIWRFIIVSSLLTCLEW